MKNFIRGGLVLGSIVLITSTLFFSTQGLNTIDAARQFFSTKNSHDVLITAVLEKETTFLFSFEDASNILIPKTILSAVTYEEGGWKIILSYNDTTTQTVLARGESIVINQEDIVMNPYDKNLLGAETHFMTTVPGTITVTIKKQNEDGFDLTYDVEGSTTEHRVPLWGLYANATNKIVITLQGPYGERASTTISITPSVVEENIKVDSVRPTNASTPLFPLLFLVNGSMFDQAGNLRFLFSGKENALYPLANGLIATESEDRSEVIIFTLSGKEVERYTVPYKAHHEIIEKAPGGNLLVATNHADAKYLDAIIEIERGTGIIVKTWDLREYFDETRAPLAPPRPESWLHLNSIQYDLSDNTLLISARSQNLVAKIGYDDGKVHWILSNHVGWAPPYEQHLLNPTNFNTEKDTNQDWTYLQHSATLQPDNRVMIFDNGGGRPGFSSSSKTFGPTAEGGYVRAVEYQINEKEKTVTKTFEYSDFPTRGSVKKGSVYVVNDEYLLIGYGEFNSATLIKKATTEKLFEINFGEGTFYRAYPIFWKQIKSGTSQ